VRADHEIPSHGERLAAWHYVGVDGDFTTAAGRPCVVMAHGYAATRDCGLEGYAERFAAAGLDALVVDYRGFGASSGEPRRVVDPAAQQDDYRAAVARARTLAGVDPARVIVWGVSLSAGHVFRVAGTDPAVAAAIALTPAVDGPAAVRGLMPSLGAGAARLTAAVTADLLAAARGGKPIECAVAGPPGSPAVLCTPGAVEAYQGIAGPTWTNSIPARSALNVGRFRVGRRAADVRCPMLVQIADEDQLAPSGPARTAAFRARADVRHYPCDHFDVYPGSEWFERAVAHQLHFLHRHLAPGSAFAPASPMVVNS
jgi:uncharacterized protein